MIDKEKMFLQMGDNEPIPVTEIPEFEIKCEVYEMNGSGYQLINPEELKDAKEINKITDILINADAVTCDARFGPEYYRSNALYAIPSGYTVTVNFEKLAKALWNHGYRLVKGDEK